MRVGASATIVFLVGILSTSVVHAACTGTNGRGWGSGQGAGKFAMSASDKSCRIGFTNFIDDKKKTQVPATQVTVTRGPKSGKVQVTGKGLVYTPNGGFKGSDTFCTKNTSPKVKGTLAGCITVTVR